MTPYSQSFLLLSDPYLGYSLGTSKESVAHPCLCSTKECVHLHFLLGYIEIDSVSQLVVLIFSSSIIMLVELANTIKCLILILCH